ncbi:toxin-antitoxin system HicB family antitoxin [Nakamurella aerolata]|uniref:Toxin-antitoxin system HicB family antitoxin n=1 Tax=Nakamurella aerolata TaxID=1656892 RepID=A0A849A6X9_9ACTN|nr:toxin-antitoxin system HicB family antitoxin [Nakamurella aerolata]NNG34260.1 toxin-antitoxin system HicB family antitoxin [Nakamurella aerolata]
MDLSPYVDQLRRDLVRAAALGDEQTRRTAEALAGSIESSARLMLLSALSDLAGEITGALDDTTVEVRLDGQDLRVTVEQHDRDELTDADAGTDSASWDATGPRRRGRGPHGRRPYPHHPARPGPSPRGSGSGDADDPDGDPDDLKRAMREAGNELSRTTVRLFNDLKSQAESAASDQGVSLNTYISRAISDSVKGIRQPKSPRRRGSGNSGGTVSGWIQG